MQSLDDGARRAVEALVNQLFREIRTARPGWRQAWPTTEVLEASKATWVKTFVEAGVTDWDSQIAYGLQGLRAEPSDWVPSPGKFVTWCQPTPEALGLPSLEAAYAEALSKSHPAMAGAARWSCPEVYHAAARAGFNTLQVLSRSDGLALLEEQYRKIRRDRARCVQLPPVPVAAIPAQPHRTPEVGKAALAELRAKMKGARHA
ncbi:replication protein P [Pseudomonas sp. B1-22]|uniref:replication protein P n=1 Tax=Pseudomonas sp. B1-22 TaxID=3141456 RepID=UPI003D2CC56E